MVRKFDNIQCQRLLLVSVAAEKVDMPLQHIQGVGLHAVVAFVLDGQHVEAVVSAVFADGPTDDGQVGSIPQKWR